MKGMQLQQGALALSMMLPMLFIVFVINLVQELMFELADICTHTTLCINIK